uniref:Glucuronosyltransferase n=1 Tax=Panagrolaimus sp. ES5 TaxID=591445 RepID=A0AC34G9R6_9BILA
MISNGRIADTLAEAGHDVTFLSVEGMIPTADFPTTKLAKVVILGRIPEEWLTKMKKYRSAAMNSAFEKPGIFDTSFDFIPLINGVSSLMELALVESEETIEKLKTEKFDAIFYEQLFPHGASFGYLLGIEIHFLINSCPIQGHITSLFGIPDATGWVPAVWRFGSFR